MTIQIVCNVYKTMFHSCRELREESDLKVLPSDLTKIGIIDFEFCNDPVILEVHIFTAVKFEGNPIETEGRLY